MTWLDDDETRAWRGLIEVSNRLFFQLGVRLQQRSGLSFEDYEVLVHLSESAERRLRMSELADRAVFSRSRLTHRITNLEKRGLVERVPVAEDGRGLWAVLTAEGFRQIDEAAPAHAADVRSLLFDQLEPDEVVALAAWFERVRANLVADPPAGTSGPVGSD